MPDSKTLIKRDSDFISGNMRKTALIRAMRKHGLTATKVIKPIVEALNASKLIVHGDTTKDDQSWVEEVPDHSTRLRAAQIGIELLGLKQEDLHDYTKDKAAKSITKALSNGDEVELQRILFNKKKTE